MSEKLTQQQIDFLRKPQFAHVATVLQDGSPQVTAVWIDTDGEAVIFNTSIGRVKERALRRDPRVAISIVDRDDPYLTMVIKGRAELVEEGALEHINSLNQKYHGNPNYPLSEGMKRVIVRVTPEKISGRV